jgi:hypothetical protein
VDGLDRLLREREIGADDYVHVLLGLGDLVIELH